MSPFTLDLITPKIIKLRVDANLWNISYLNNGDIETNPISSYAADFQQQVTAIATHVNGFSYYLTSPTSTSGFRVTDCEDVIEEPTPEPEPELVQPPEPQSTTIVQNIPVPTSKDPYKLVTSVKTYNYPKDALEDKNAQTAYPAGKYYKRWSKFGMDYITKHPKQSGFWINPADNVLEPLKFPEPSIPIVEPEPKVVFRSQQDRFGSYAPYDYPEYFRADKGEAAKNGKAIVFNFLDPNKNRTINFKQKVYIAGTFVEDDMLYGRPANLIKGEDGIDHFAIHNDYGILMSNLSHGQIDYIPIEDTSALIPHSRTITPVDRITQLQAKGKKFINDVKRVL